MSSAIEPQAARGTFFFGGAYVVVFTAVNVMDATGFYASFESLAFAYTMGFIALATVASGYLVDLTAHSVSRLGFGPALIYHFVWHAPVVAATAWLLGAIKDGDESASFYALCTLSGIVVGTVAAARSVRASGRGTREGQE